MVKPKSTWTKRCNEISLQSSVQIKVVCPLPKGWEPTAVEIVKGWNIAYNCGWHQQLATAKLNGMETSSPDTARNSIPLQSLPCPDSRQHGTCTAGRNDTHYKIACKGHTPIVQTKTMKIIDVELLEYEICRGTWRFPRAIAMNFRQFWHCCARCSLWVPWLTAHCCATTMNPYSVQQTVLLSPSVELQNQRLFKRSYSHITMLEYFCYALHLK